MGGMICPPVEATASIAAATGAEYPERRINGIVITPVDTTLETALPDMEPKKPDAITAILAEPPRVRPIRAAAISVKKSDPPARKRTWPKKTKIIIYGLNSNDEKVYSKYEQLVKLGAKHVYIYNGGMFEWLLLQDVYGRELFPTTLRELDILKYKPRKVLDILCIKM